MKTELIIAKKLVMIKGIEKLLITTISNTQIWVNKDGFDNTAEVITYQTHAAGTKYTNKAGVEITRDQPQNEYVGCDVQRVTKFNAVELYAELKKLGITPAISM